MAKGFCCAPQSSCSSCNLIFKDTRGQKVTNQNHFVHTMLLYLLARISTLKQLFHLFKWYDSLQQIEVKHAYFFQYHWIHIVVPCKKLEEVAEDAICI